MSDPIPQRAPWPRGARPVLLAGILLISGAFFLPACQDPAGFPPTLDAGLLTFSFDGLITGTFTADGRCYWSTGYPAADSACAVAFDLGDTLRLRGVRTPREPSWVHVNVEFPPDGDCGAGGPCRIAMDFLSPSGRLESAYRSTSASVTIEEHTADRLRGTFTGRAALVNGNAGDTIQIYSGEFDVPVER